MNLSKQIFEFNEQQKFIFSLEQIIRITDINYGNHLAAASLPNLIHQTRVCFLDQYGYNEGNISGAGLILANQYLSFLSTGHFNEKLLFDFGVDSITDHGAIFVYRINNLTKNCLLAIVKEKIVFFDYAKQKPMRTPSAFVDLIKKLENNI